MNRLTGMVIVVVVGVVSGCATQMNVQQQAVQIAGKPFTYVLAEGKDPSGVNFVVMDRYDGEGRLVSRDAASGNGILHAVIPAVIDGAATAGGLIGAASVLRPDTTNVTQTTGGTADAGASAGSGSGSGSSGSGSGSTTITVSPTVTTSSSASPVATSSSKSTATAASASTSASTATSNQSQSQATNNTNTNKGGGKTKTHTNNGHHYGHDKDKGDK